MTFSSGQVQARPPRGSSHSSVNEVAKVLGPFLGLSPLFSSLKFFFLKSKKLTSGLGSCHVTSDKVLTALNVSLLQNSCKDE